MKSSRLPLWVHLGLLMASAAWAMLGAPLDAAEWQDVPRRALQLMVQWPGRTQPVWRLWLMLGA